MSRRLYAVLAIIIAMTALTGVNLYYTAHEQRVADQRWCDLLDSMDQPGAPPTTDRGRLIQVKIHKLRRGLGCGGG